MPAPAQAPVQDFVLGGIATSAAALFTNPIEVVKVRMQLQGELSRARGKISGPYRNPLHAFYTIGVNEGLSGLQKGLLPAILYQFVMNGVRLGSYGIIKYHIGLKEDKYTEASSSLEEVISFSKRVAAAALAGAVGAVSGSPLYLIKTRMQAQSNAIPGVGAQHVYLNTVQAFKHIVKHDGGVLALMRGANAASIRVATGSAVQLPTYDTCKELLLKWSPEWVFPSHGDSKRLHLVSSMVTGLMVCTAMNPFDVISTRIYNQKVTADGKGELYKGPIDCFKKIAQTEGWRGFYKGWVAHYFRVGPHTVLTFLFFEQLKIKYRELKSAEHS